jgi:signal transduction histidine kinase/ligand-binding sensor domain-containing protein
LPSLHSIVFLLVLFFPFIIRAQQQNYVFQNFTAKDGIASDKVNCTLQDSKGFYWVGTDNGLQRFDGKNFSNLPGDENKKSSHTSTPIADPILEDKLGNIWGRSGFLISVYYRLTGSYENIKIKDNTANTAISDIQYFCKDEWGDIWIVTSMNLYKYDYKIHKAVLWLTLFRKTDNSPWLKIIYDNIKKGLWIIGGSDIILIDLKSKKIKNPFSDYPPKKTGSKGSIAYEYPMGLFIDSKYNIWFGLRNGFIYKYNTLTFQKEVYDVRVWDKQTKKQILPLVSCFIEDCNEKIWIGSLWEGLFYYDEEKDSIRPVAINNNIPHSIHFDHDIYNFCRDNEGNILACTDKGISIFNPCFQRFITLNENNLQNPFPNAEVTRIFETSTGNILVGTWGEGWFYYDKNFRIIKQFYSNNPHIIPERFKKNLVWSFAEDHHGKIWIGYQYGLLGIFDISSQHIQYIDVPQFDGKTIMAMQCDDNGNIWFGLYSGFLGKWDAAKHEFFIYKNSLPFHRGNAAAISNILINGHEEIWVTTNGNGFYCFDPKKEKITETHTFKSQDSTFDPIHSLTQIDDSIIGISTASNGFLLFNERQKKFNSVTMQDGLPDNNICGLAQDKQKNLWIVTTNGLLKMDIKNHKLVSFAEEDGLPDKFFKYNIVLLHDGRMAIPTSTGIVYFSPDNIKTLPAPPDVQISGFKVFDQSLLIDSLLFDNKRIELNHLQNFITISYASLSFLGINTTKYFYQLKGVDKDWVNGGTQRVASYTDLSPGHYTFKVRCENRDGIPSKKNTELNIYISAPWWFTWWAYTLYALFAASAMYALYLNHINELKRKQSAQLKVMVATQEEERKRISRDLHDDVGTKLSALKLFLSSLHEKAADTNNEEIQSLAESSEQFITEAMQDVRQLLLNLSPTVLEEFGYTTAVEGLVHKINETKQIHFSLVVFGMNHRLQKDYELALYRITQELINNVLKHAGAKNVSLQIGQRDEKIILMIEDDGKGFDVSAHKDGYGLHNLDARTELMNGTMTIDSQQGKGTSVLIEIPYELVD